MKISNKSTVQSHQHQFAKVFIQTVCFICLCDAAIMAVIILLLIPSMICIIWVVLAVISDKLGVLGMMSYLGIYLDVITTILITRIRFSVQFSAHISYHYHSADQDPDSEKRLAHCLQSPRTRSSILQRQNIKK